MKELLNFRFSEFSVLTVLFLGILLSLLMGLLRRIVLNKITKNKNKQWYQIGELAVWILYAAWALHSILGDSLYYQMTILLILIVIVIWVSWFVVRDFIAGLVLKLNDSFQPGQYFKLGEIEGTILSADYLQLNLHRENGVIIKIPYNKISGAIHYKGEAEDQSMQHQFELEIADKYSLQDVRSLVREAVLLSAGARFSREPRVIHKGTEDKKQKYEVTISALSPDYNKLIESNVKEYFK